jgi:hypothetical protein
MIELSPFQKDARGAMSAILSSASTAQQIKTAQAMARFRQQDGKLIRKIGMPYFIAWTVVMLLLAMILLFVSNLLGFAMFCVAPIGYVGAFALAARKWDNHISKLMDFPTMLATSDTLAINEPLTVQYSQHFKQDTTVELLRVQLVKREWVRYTQGTNTYTDTRDIVMDEDWRDMLDIRAGDTVEHEFTFTVPSDAMHSWRTASDNKIFWMLRLDVDMPGWFDYKEMYEIVVKPEIYKTNV